MGWWGGESRKPAIEHTAAPVELDIPLDQARMALAVTVIDDALAGDRTDPSRLCNALLEVRHALAPGRRPLDRPVPYVPGRAS